MIQQSIDAVDPALSGLGPLLLQAVANMPGGSVNIFDRELRYLFAAGRGLADVGLSPAMLVGRTLSEVFGEEATAPVRSHYARALAGESVTFELPMGERIYHISAAPLPANDAIVAVAHEVTDLRRHQESLAEKNRYKDEFILTLAHELRQPLGPMLMALDVMRKKVSAATGERAREVVDRQVRQLQRLTDDLMDAARVSQGRTELQCERLDLRALVEQVLALQEPEIASRRLELQRDLPEQPLWVHGDPVRLQQVFSNIIHNALKFSAEGGRLAVSARCDGSAVQARVRDTGRGIAPDVLPHIFEMFVQSKSSHAGLGIGLAVVKRLVEAHGGTVSVQSDGPDTGAEFMICLPASSEGPATDA